jgi:hypothetical protein
MSSWEESVSWTRDAVLERESAPELVCKVLERDRASEKDGTDGCRLLCHQFFTSSLPRQGNCISRYDIFWRKVN